MLIIKQSLNNIKLVTQANVIITSKLLEYCRFFTEFDFVVGEIGTA
nr:hypothetical protein predicted by Glimmer/Critica [Erwinia amylovora ATCC BAA-2158]